MLFKHFKNTVAKQFQSMADTGLFRVSADRNALWERPWVQFHAEKPSDVPGQWFIQPYRKNHVLKRRNQQ